MTKTVPEMTTKKHPYNKKAQAGLMLFWTFEIYRLLYVITCGLCQ